MHPYSIPADQISRVRTRTMRKHDPMPIAPVLASTSIKDQKNTAADSSGDDDIFDPGADRRAAIDLIRENTDRPFSQGVPRRAMKWKEEKRFNALRALRRHFGKEPATALWVFLLPRTLDPAGREKVQDIEHWDWPVLEELHHIVMLCRSVDVINELLAAQVLVRLRKAKAEGRIAGCVGRMTAEDVRGVREEIERRATYEVGVGFLY
ncbi:hypothetical protein LTR85_010077 [Meristemomyces frigidus]|nr:hypothetical protein LTR85_010077 [Meristemomyces frigidus]